VTDRCERCDAMLRTGEDRLCRDCEDGA